MYKYLEIIKSCPLFAEINESELQKLLDCLGAAEKHYEKNQFIFSAGDPAVRIGIVLTGAVHVIQEDFWGDRVILAGIGEGGMFGEAFSCAEINSLPVSVVAVQPADILFVDYGRIMNTCPAVCSFHLNLIKNMMKILAAKNVMLTQKMEFLTRRTIREKLLAYLSAQAQAAGSNKFVIPFNRQELAQYLSVDRSALSAELSRMRDDGLLSFQRNNFTLY